MAGIGLRKLETERPLSARIARRSLATAPVEPDEPQPTAAELVHSIAGMMSQLAAALEREEERLDSEFVSLATGLRELEQRPQAERWPALMFRQEAARYLGVSPDLLDHLAREGHVAPQTLPGITTRMYAIETLDAYRASGQR